MPFGLSNALATFQGYVNKILAEKLDIFIVVYLDDILIYTEDSGQPYVEAVRWVLDQLRKHSLFVHLKKYRFYQDEVRFLGYVVSSKGINMEAKRIEVIKDWPELKSVRNIQVFLGFANFYRRFIQGFSRIAAPLTSMLKTTESPDEPAPSRNDDSRPASGRNDGDGEVDGFGVGGNGVEHAKKSGKSKSEKTSKSRNSAKSGKKLSKSGNSTNFDATEDGPKFLTPDARTAFNHLRLAFTEAPILWHFDPECHIWIETDASGYAIGGVLSQLTSGTNPDGVVTKADLGQWHPVAFFLRKMIPAETRYETHDGELLAIVEAFKTWRHYLEGCKHEVLVLTDHNNLCRFMDTKSLSSRQVRWAQELSQYHFQIDYRQGKANAAADALSRFPQRSQDEEDELRAENGRIFHYLQNSLTNASLAGLSLPSSLPSHLHQVLICGTYVLPQLRHFWDGLRKELASEGPYKASIGGMRLRLQELQGEDKQARKLRAEQPVKDNWEDINGVLHHQGLPYISEIIRTELISKHHDNPLAGHFGIEKTHKLVTRKYY